MYALLFIAAAAGKDVFFSQKKLSEIPALARVCMMVLVAMIGLCALWFADVGSQKNGLPAVSFPVWVFVHPLFMMVGLIHQMRSLSMGPVTKTQPMMALSLVMYTLAAAIFGQGLGVVSVVGALAALWGMVVCARQDGPKKAPKIREAWQISGNFDVDFFRVDNVVDNTPPDVNPTFTSVKTLLRKNGLTGGLKAAFKEHWHKSGVFNAGFGAMFLWIALYFEGLSVRASDSKTFLFCDLIIMSWYLLMMVAVSRVNEILNHAKALRKKKAKPGKEVKEPTLMRQLWLGGLCYGASLFFLQEAWKTMPFSLAPVYMSLPIVALSAWGYFRRKERKFTLARGLGLLAVLVGSVMMLYGM